MSGPTRPRLIRRRLARLAIVVALGVVVGTAGYLAARVLTAPGPRAAPGWSLLPEMPSSRGETAAAVVGDQLVVIGGMTGLNFDASDLVSVYDASTRSWTAGPPLPAARHHAAAASIDGTVYLSGGTSANLGGAPSTEVWALPEGGTAWRAVAAMPDGRFGHRLVAVGDHLYAVGGLSSGAVADEGGVQLLIYDATADSWSTGAPLPVNRDHLAVVVVGTRIWAIGGRSGGVNLDRVDIYDPATDTWSAGPPLPVPTSGAAEAAVDGMIYVSGGEDPPAGTIVDRHWQFAAGAAVLDTFWTPMQIPPLAVHGASGANLNGRFVIVAGSTRAGGQSNTAWTGALQELLLPR